MRLKETFGLWRYALCLLLYLLPQTRSFTFEFQSKTSELIMKWALTLSDVCLQFGRPCACAVCHYIFSLLLCLPS